MILREIERRLRRQDGELHLQDEKKAGTEGRGQ